MIEPNYRVEFMEKQLVYIGLGGNIGDPITTFDNVIERLSLASEITDLRSSPFYSTSPVSDIPQDDYLNAVCVFKTSFTAETLQFFLANIERKLGKLPKEKDAPRIIDIDILFYGSKQINLPDLEIPHPRWKERLFVLRPLADLTDHISLENETGQIECIDLKESLKNFMNRHNEIVTQLEKV
jgi:2-amino-4-hydroxy-6-hydroxymethyldihydropteridine diphosphokinase